MKLYMALNMHYPLPELFTKSEVTLRLKRDAKSVVADLDQNIVELTLDIPEKDVINPEKYAALDADLAPGLYDHGINWVYKGDPVKITNTKTVKKARLPIVEDIPRVSIVAVVNREVLLSPHWYHHADILAVIERYKPKWGAKGYVFDKVGNDKVRLDYIPLTVNPTAVTTLITSLMAFAEQAMEQLPTVVTDHGSQQEFLDL